MIYTEKSELLLKYQKTKAQIKELEFSDKDKRTNIKKNDELLILRSYVHAYTRKLDLNKELIQIELKGD